MRRSPRKLPCKLEQADAIASSELRFADLVLFHVMIGAQADHRAVRRLERDAAVCSAADVSTFAKVVRAARDRTSVTTDPARRAGQERACEAALAGLCIGTAAPLGLLRLDEGQSSCVSASGGGGAVIYVGVGSLTDISEPTQRARSSSVGLPEGFSPVPRAPHQRLETVSRYGFLPFGKRLDQTRHRPASGAYRVLQRHREASPMMFRLLP